ncbi:RNA polymerase sigma factor [Autumnicola musiva]|uniref:RNA polymerase sigma-70 factor n=1 Tax=Autumnicola musiva TaxID=3075589 RepID=A0ABU3DAD3_9FLAO|nr:RNA polymerase sigma-70 factor [Zunongwangia sp. F117]MDT0678495.1 RNA polymerase sigma-70 factor [Zunongwangia sp. F117]
MKKNSEDKKSVGTLMGLIRQGDENAFAILFDKLWESLFTHALKLLGSKNIAEDIVQDVWIDFWKRRDKINNDNVEAYLYKAVTYKVYKELRDTKFTTSQLEILEQLPTPLESNHELYLADTRKKIENIMETLPAKCKEIFILSRFKGLKNDEISAHLDISQRTVENHISKAIKKMKQNLSYIFFFI